MEFHRQFGRLVRNIKMKKERQSSSKNKPPGWAIRILRWYCRQEYLDEIEGDLYELYRRRRQKYGHFRTSALYTMNVMGFFRLYNFKGFKSFEISGVTPAILENYFKVTGRSFVRNKTTSFLTLGGLIIGIATTLLLGLYIYDELSFDNFHPNEDLTYRLYSEYKGGREGRDTRGGWTYYGFAKEIEAKIPEVERTLRVKMYGTSEELMEANGVKFNEQFRLEAESSFFDFFGFKLLHGDPTTALSEPHNIILTEKIALKYFNRTDIVGENVRLNNASDFVISAVAEDPPYNTHLNYSYIVPFTPQDNRPWRRTCETYLRLYKHTEFTVLDEKIGALAKSIPELKYIKKIGVLGIRDVYLSGEFDHGRDRQGSMLYIYIFSSIGILVLIIAFINYTNLTTAAYLKRSFEMGVRKIVGAGKANLLLQQFAETYFFIFLATIVAGVAVYFLVPEYNNFLERDLSLSSAKWRIIGILAALPIVFTAIAGLYPALSLSNFKSSKAIKGKTQLGNGKMTRKGLVIFQFLVCQVLILATLTIHGQMNYLRNKNLGFKKDQMLIIPLKGSAVETHKLLKTEFLRLTGIISASVSMAVPGKNFGISFYSSDEIEDFDNDSLSLVFDDFLVDEDFFENYEMDLVNGRFLSRDFPSDSANSLLINETSLNILGWDDPLGKKMENKQVVGVVKDFHNNSLKTEIKPLIFGISHLAKDAKYLSLKLRSSDYLETVGQLKDTWESMITDYPFDYFFLDDYFDNMYRSEERLGKIMKSFTVLAVFIGLLGLIGLAIFMTKQRTNEIGVRKTFGATVMDVFGLVTWDFLKLILIGIIIAIPIALYIMNQWLQNFAYRITPDWWLILASSLFTMVIALLAIGGQTVKAAMISPSETLRQPIY